MLRMFLYFNLIQVYIYVKIFILLHIVNKLCNNTSYKVIGSSFSFIFYMCMTFIKRNLCATNSLPGSNTLLVFVSTVQVGNMNERVY